MTEYQGYIIIAALFCIAAELSKNDFVKKIYFSGAFTYLLVTFFTVILQAIK